EATLNGEKSLPAHAVRQKAFEAFSKAGIPNSKHEEWKYTNLNPLFGKGYEPIVSAAEKVVAHIHTFPFIKSNRLVFIDGIYSEQYSHIIDKNISISHLQKEFHDNNPLVNEYFSKIAEYETESIVALNTASSHDGAFIHVPQNTMVE